MVPSDRDGIQGEFVPVDMRYLTFCPPATAFYDVSDAATETAFPQAANTPPGWQCAERDPWVSLVPVDSTIPEQGWKIHVSAHLGNAENVLRIVWNYCLQQELSFKFLRSKEKLRESCVKYADRGSSGKFVTIYPRNEEELKAVLEDLDEQLSGEDGPYVLSDLRWRNGPLYVRYGAFSTKYLTTAGGDRLPAITTPDGELVEDRRRPRFTVPDWVEVPDFLREQIDAAKKSSDSPYQPLHALHFSNGGGVYEATEKASGRRVVLKEARPHSGVDVDGNDAVVRLRREAAVLERLAGSGWAPEIYDYRRLWEHHFIVMEKIRGLDLKRASMQRIPLLKPRAAEVDTQEYLMWVLPLISKLEGALEDIHARGVVIGDLHPKNIVVDGDRPVFLDFEFGAVDDPEWRLPQGAPGYRPPRGLHGPDADRWALAAVKLDLLLPQAMLAESDSGKAAQLVELAARRYSLSDDFAESLLRDMGLALPTNSASQTTLFTGDLSAAAKSFLDPIDEPNWPAVRDSMVDAVLTSATPERDDRLFPGDIQQFLGDGTGGVTFAHGAAGVLYALTATGNIPKHEHVSWLTARLDHAGFGAGFYDGLHGIAFALAGLGLASDASRVLSCARASTAELSGHSLLSGLSGAGLNLLHFADLDTDPSLRDEAIDVSARLAEGLSVEWGLERRAGARPGLFTGWSGPALFWIRLYESTCAGEYLELARSALQADLRNCVLTVNGTMEADDGWRTLPYLHTGSVGVGIVLTEYLRHHQPDELSEVDESIELAAGYEQYGMPIVSHGSAGILLYLAHKRAHRPSSRTCQMIDQVLENFRHHALPYSGHVAFRGNQSLRLSMDLTTGTAGVLLAIGNAIGSGSGLPFL